ncbi:MAG: hypothetical protein ACJ761_11775 [Chloroflexota bacterium]
MTREELIVRTRQLIDEGERLAAKPSLHALRLWLTLSDGLLSTAWGSMDRYHLAWLMVGKPKQTIRGRAMTEGEEAAYVREVAEQKTAALRMSLDAVERQGMPFLGETGRQGGPAVPNPTAAPRNPPPVAEPGGLGERLAEARRRAAAHRAQAVPRAPRPGRVVRG